ncbi:MAG: 2-aminoethylphosphonate--pyruvate transaminase [Bacilli bacterium]
MKHNDYLLLTPGPLSTSVGVRSALLQDWCTWDDSYHALVQKIRTQLLQLATKQTQHYTTVLMQGSGSFSVESTLTSCINRDRDVLLLLSNGAYGRRMIEMAKKAGIRCMTYEVASTETIDCDAVSALLAQHNEITHVAVVHCETTTGILNPIAKIGELCKMYQCTYIVDGMSSFGGIAFDIAAYGIDYLISSSNKCIQGVPGFGFVLCRRSLLTNCKGNATTVSLDLYAQWEEMEQNNGKWRFTSPTHSVHAFSVALDELIQEGGIEKRQKRYTENQKILSSALQRHGWRSPIEHAHQSPIITSFYYPNENFDFKMFYNYLKENGFVIYPGKIEARDTFRIGTIGDVFPEDIEKLVQIILKYEKDGVKS